MFKVAVLTYVVVPETVKLPEIVTSFENVAVELTCKLEPTCRPFLTTKSLEIAIRFPLL
jgi:hypothetical protein